MYSITHECLQIRCSNFLSLLTLFSEFYLLNLVDIAQFKIKIIVHARYQRKNRAEIRSWLLQNLCSLNTRRGSLAQLAAPVSNKSSPCGVLLPPSMDPKKFIKTTHFTLVFGSLFQFKKILQTLILRSHNSIIDFFCIGRLIFDDGVKIILYSRCCIHLNVTWPAIMQLVHCKKKHIETTWQVVLNIQDAES